MGRETSSNRLTLLQHAMRYFMLLMALLYIAAGQALVWGRWAIRGLDEQYTFLLGLVLTGYGLFRAYRFYQKHKRPHYE